MQSGSYSREGKEKATPEGHEKVTEGYASVLFLPAKESKQTKTRKDKEDNKKNINAGQEEEKEEGGAVVVKKHDSKGVKANQNQQQAAKEKKKEASGQGAVGGSAVDEDDQSVFYNPAQVVNRDLSISVIQTFANIRATETRKKGGTGDAGITVLEALSATGLRAIRYWKEIKGLKSIIANDLDPDAVDAIKRNCDYNGVPLISGGGGSVEASAAASSTTIEGVETKKEEIGIIPNCDDAIVLMQRLGLDPNMPYRFAAVDKETKKPLLDAPPLLQCEKVDVVDLDPYGTASPFVDSAMQSAKEGALMLVTCTDSSILCGNYPETCYGKYGSFSTRIDSCHEVAARIVLGLLETTANKHKKYIQPLLSLHIDFYVRVFVRVWTSPAEVKRSCCKMASLYHCTRCPFYKVLPLANTKPTRNQKRKAAEKDKADVLKRPRDEATTTAEETVATSAPATAGGGGDVERSLPAPWVFPTPCPRTEIAVTQCASATNIPSTCEACGSRVLVAGPIYGAPTHDREFLSKLMETINEKAAGGHLTAVDRIKGLVASAADELPDVPLFYDLPEVASALSLHLPSTAVVVSALAKLGYASSQVHCKPSGIKTNAPPEILFGVIKHFNAQHPPKVKQEKTEDSAERKAKKAENQKGGANRKELYPAKPTISYPEVVCDLKVEKEFDWRSKTTGVVKFVLNAPFWGPKRRHQGAKKEDGEDDE